MLLSGSWQGTTSQTASPIDDGRDAVLQIAGATAATFGDFLSETKTWLTMRSEQLLDDAYSWAKASYEADHIAAAYEVLQNYLEYRPRHSYAWFIAGDCLRRLGRSLEARDALFKALRLAPASKKEVVYCHLAMLFAGMGLRRRAERWFRRATGSAEGSGMPWLWVLRGANLIQQGELELAEACYRRAIEIGPDDPDEAHLNLGYVLRALRKYDEAAHHFRIAGDISGSKEAEFALTELQGTQEAEQWIRQLNAECA